jgi:hypothetical protein
VTAILRRWRARRRRERLAQFKRDLRDVLAEFNFDARGIDGAICDVLQKIAVAGVKSQLHQELRPHERDVPRDGRLSWWLAAATWREGSRQSVPSAEARAEPQSSNRRGRA